MRYKVCILAIALLLGAFSTAHAQQGFWFFNGTEFETIFSGSLRVPALDCTGNTNGGALTADANGVISCSDDDSGAGGDNVTVNGAAIDTTANFLDGDIDFTLVDGGAGGPDDITATVGCSGCVDGTDLADNVVDFQHILQSNTLAGNPALLVDECYFVATATGGGFICEGSTANTNEQLYLFPDVDGADTTFRIVVDNTQVTSIDGASLTITSGVLDVDVASLTVVGAVELATAAEVDTGTDAGRAVTPDGLAASNLGQRCVSIEVFGTSTDTATGDGKKMFHVPSPLDGMNLVEVHAEVYTSGTTNETIIQINNDTGAADMLSTTLRVDSSETGSDTAATAAVIDSANDDIATNDRLEIDIDAIHTTAAKGLVVTMCFSLP